MKFINLAKNYQRLFHFEGVTFFMNDIWMAFYKKLDAMITAINDDCYMWLPKDSLDAQLDEGEKFFANNKQFESYYNAHVKYLKSHRSTFVSEVKGKETLTRRNVRKFLDLCRLSLSFFYRTEFFFTDKAYQLSKTDPTIKKNLMRNYALKEKSRVEIFNRTAFGDNSYYNQLFRKLSKQFGLAESDLNQYSVDKIYKLFDGQKLTHEIVEDRKVARIVVAKQTVIKIYAGSQVKDDIWALLKKTGETTLRDLDVLRGVPASGGKVVGRVKIIVSNPATFDLLNVEIAKMKKGDILVAETTSPEFLPACKKASAILTNQGGLLSHAAVISREFGIPCVVGLRHATRVLKDGDRVEVDATKGLVKKL
jgi:phosphohistidine swiveling domain-containing protein